MWDKMGVITITVFLILSGCRDLDPANCRKNLEYYLLKKIYIITQKIFFEVAAVSVGPDN